MGHSDDREKMDRALKDIVVPELRTLGFRGSYPHFHRERGNHVDLLFIQFNRYGGSFVAEIAYAGPDCRNTRFWPGKRDAKALHVGDTSDRLRLGCDPSSKDPQRQSDHWFKFSGFRVSGLFGDRFAKLADEVVARLHDQGVPWWEERRRKIATEAEEDADGRTR